MVYCNTMSSEKRWIARNTFEREVPPLKAIGKQLGIENKYCNAQHNQTSFSRCRAERPILLDKASKISRCSFLDKSKNDLVTCFCLFVLRNNFYHPIR